MGTLSRDLDAYQRALAIYQRRGNAYNRSIAQDPNGNPYLIAKSDYNPENIYAGGALPQGKGTYGSFGQASIRMADKNTGAVSIAENAPTFVGATDNGDPNFLLLRQNPRGYESKVFSGVRKSGGGVDDNGYPIPEQFYMNGPADGEGNPTAIPVDMNRAKVLGQPDESGNYTIEYQVPKFADKPDDFNMKAPDASPAAVRRDQRPSVVEQEGGLIGEVIASRGLKGGGDFPAQRGLINKARDDRAAAAKLEEEKLAAEKARLEAEEAARNAPADYGSVY
jgi:hypothetical protein